MIERMIQFYLIDKTELLCHFPCYFLSTDRCTPHIGILNILKQCQQLQSYQETEEVTDADICQLYMIQVRQIKLA